MIKFFEASSSPPAGPPRDILPARETLGLRTIPFASANASAPPRPQGPESGNYSTEPWTMCNNWTPHLQTDLSESNIPFVFQLLIFSFCSVGTFNFTPLWLRCTASMSIEYPWWFQPFYFFGWYLVILISLRRYLPAMSHRIFLCLTRIQSMRRTL